ncbi:MAG TPA: SAM-dependent methyltransferase [Actinomycetota bacterium]|nr:SAM-dependent methyltransferase [Actinomycetota bacterium]
MTVGLVHELTARIRRGGPLTFAAFMHAALYDPEHGYYAAHQPGHGGHYATSSSVSPWFGRLLARELAGIWEALGCPDPFTVLEVGAGQGDLAAEALQEAFAWPVADALRWRFVERFAPVRDLQHARLGALAERSAWTPALGDGSPVTGCLLANEVLDNFPVHVLEKARGEVGEVYVDADGRGLYECLGPLSCADLAAPAVAAAPHLHEGDRMEVCPAFESWWQEASGALQQGMVLVLDYGDVEPDIWHRGPTGTLATYGPAGRGQAPLEAPGHQDITADVNFSAVIRAARHAGFHHPALTTQRLFLLSIGLGEVVDALAEQVWRAAACGWHGQAEVLEGEAEAAAALAAEGGLGDILVFRATKGDIAMPRSGGEA